MSFDPDRLVSITQAAALVGVSRRTIYNWMAAGMIQYVYTASGRRRIRAASLTTMGPPARIRHRVLFVKHDEAASDRWIVTFGCGHTLTLTEPAAPTEAEIERIAAHGCPTCLLPVPK